MSEETAQIKKNETQPDYVVRFNPGQRVEHIILMVTFVLLSLTGLAQLYSAAPWGEWIIMSFGGIAYTRLIHRLFAVLFAASFVYHFAVLGYFLIKRRIRLSMVPTVKDFRDAVESLRHSIGSAEQPPKFGRFDYKQKFEYWGIIFGSIIIITSGFILMYPAAVAAVLPGQVVAAAKEFHGYEATLAVLTIVMWHIYDVILKPAVFPADLSIFTGKISRKRLEEEHALEYAELVRAEAIVEPRTPAGLEPSGDGSQP